MLKKKKISIKETFFIALGTGIVSSLFTLLALFTLGNPLLQSSSPASSLTSFPPGVVSQENLVVETVKKASPAVVSIFISKETTPENEKREKGFDFREFFLPTPKTPQKTDIGGGSGFIISADGYIVTNRHLVEEKNATYTVITDKGKQYEAKVIREDTASDIAILKIDAKNLPYLTFGNSDDIQVGQTAIAIGNPLLQFNNTVSVGVISGLSRSIVAGDPFLNKKEHLEGVIQTDAAINPGSSGGPLLNLRGEVIGINVALATAENIGFAVPGNVAKKAVKDIEKK